MRWVEQSTLLFLSPVLVDPQLVGGARGSRDLGELFARGVFETPRLVVGLEVAVIRVFDGIIVFVVGSYAKGNHKAVVLSELVVSLKEAFLSEYHDGRAAKVHHLQEFEA